MKKVGVFDSGIGGLSVAKALEEQFPQLEILFRNDTKNMPYGDKNHQELVSLALPILRIMKAEGCELIVVACNTLSTTVFDELQDELGVPLIGVEPMLKEASAISESKVIVVCATPNTLASQRYQELKQDFAQNLQIIEPDCKDWSTMIESKIVDRSKIFVRIDSACRKGADVIVLGCTHYHWIETLIKQIADDRAIVLQPTDKVILRVKLALEQAR